MQYHFRTCKVGVKNFLPVKIISDIKFLRPYDYLYNFDAIALTNCAKEKV